MSVTDAQVDAAYAAYLEHDNERQSPEAMRAALEAAQAVEKVEYEYALIDNSPTSWYGHMYAIGYSEEEVRALAERHGDTLMRRIKSGEWKEVK